MLFFLLGMIVGGAFGVFFMCLLQINRQSAADPYEEDTDFEKSTAVGVDNTVKKA